jgi:hypothetical protein
MLRRRQPLLLEKLFEELSAMAAGVATSVDALPFTRDPGGEVDREILALTGAPMRLQDVMLGPPVLAELNPWYSPRTFQQLLRLWSEVTQSGSSTFIALTGAVMVSSISRALSSQTRSWGHVADRVLPKVLIDKSPALAAESWLKRIRRRVYLVAETARLPATLPALTVVRNDWANPQSRPTLPSASLLITSPPYAGAIDYTLAQRLSLNLLGYDTPEIAKLTSAEMGARRKRTDKNHVHKWAEALCFATKRQLAYLQPKANTVFVMPHKDAGREIGEESLKGMMASEGWLLQFEVDRSIRQVRARQSWTSIKKETILVFSR